MSTKSDLFRRNSFYVTPAASSKPMQAAVRKPPLTVSIVGWTAYVTATILVGI